MTVFDNPGNARMGTAPYISARQPRAANGRFTSGRAGFGWQGINSLQDKVQKRVDAINNNRADGARRLAADALAYMKGNAPWKDRTGQARQTLMAEVIDFPTQGTTQVFLGYGVFYGVFLETKTYHGVSYAIIRPTIMAFQNRLGEYLGT